MARNSAWQQIALTFNDDKFAPALFKSDDMPTNVLFEEKLRPVSRQGYTLDPKTAEKKFKEMRTALMKALANFRQSGMGDGGEGDEELSEEDKMEKSLKVYSSTVCASSAQCVDVPTCHVTDVPPPQPHACRRMPPTTCTDDVLPDDVPPHVPASVPICPMTCTPYAP